MRIIDADGHVTEANIPWRDLLPKAYSSRAPTVVKDNRGVSMVMVEGKLCPKPVGKGCGFVGAPRGRSPQATTGMWDPVRRLQDMDLEGIELEVLFGSSPFLSHITGLQQLACGILQDEPQQAQGSGTGAHPRPACGGERIAPLCGGVGLCSGCCANPLLFGEKS